MSRRLQRPTLVAAALLLAAAAHAAEVTTRLVFGAAGGKEHAPPVVLWLKPLNGVVPPTAAGHSYRLLQKNKLFSPHLLIVPVGSVVTFPNADPFFHNVFSMFDGKRFDLGLYEAGSVRTVTFSREGVSYIFCNIHPDMSAVVLSLATPYYGVANGDGVFHLVDVPAGSYELHVWVEGRRDDALNHLTRQVTVSADGTTDLGDVVVGPPSQPTTHLNKFGQPYDTHRNSY